MDFNIALQRLEVTKAKILKSFRSTNWADLHSEDESLIDTENLLWGDQERTHPSERTRWEEALIVNLSNNKLVRAIQHPVGEHTHTIPVRHRKQKPNTSCFYDVVCYKLCIKHTVQQEQITHLLVWSLRAEFGAIRISSASTWGWSTCSLS